MARAKRHYIPGYVWHAFELREVIAPYGKTTDQDSGNTYLWNQ
jgi:hypothetical protein